MPNYQVQMVLTMASNLPADYATNSWSCEADDVSAAEAFKDELVTFYAAIRLMYPSTVNNLQNIYKIYDRADAIPRAPVSEGTWQFGAATTGNPLPPEVAKVLSFQGAPESGVSQARKRGRVYIGPLSQVTLDDDGRPDPTYIDLLRDAADDLLEASDTATDWTWTVYSQTTGDSFNVDNGWVDNEFDTQRRRGWLATTRTTF